MEYLGLVKQQDREDYWAPRLHKKGKKEKFQITQENKLYP